MPGVFTNVHLATILEVVALLLVWFVLFRVAHLLLMVVRHGPLIGWAIGPMGVTILFLHEPSVLFLWLDVLIPAAVSGLTVYLGLFTPLSPLSLPHILPVEIVIVAAGVLITSTGDLVNAVRDIRHPLWGEARVLRNIQLLRAAYAKIYFTPFGYSYLNDHFNSSPTDLLRLLQG